MKLGVKITVAGIIVMMLVISAMLSVSIFSTRSALEKKIGESQLELAKSTMGTVDRVLYTALQDIRSIAESESVEDFMVELGEASADTHKDFHKGLEESTLLTGPWDVLFVVDKNGIVVASSFEEENGEHIEEDPENNMAFNAARDREIYYSDLVISEETNKPTIIFAAPVRDEEQPGRPVVGVVIGNFAWPVIVEILEGLDVSHAHLYNKDGFLIASNLAEHKGEYLSEANRNPSFIEHTLTQGDMHMTQQSNEGTFEALLGHTKQQGHLKYKGSEWILLLETPTSIAFAPIKKVIRNMLLVGFVLLIATILLALYLARSITKPIIKLKDTADKISKGNLAEPIEVKGNDEISELGESFDNMRYSLKMVIDEYEGMKGKGELLDKLQKEMGERAKAEEMVEIFKKGFDASSNSGLLVDYKNNKPHILHINKAFTSFYGYNEKDVLGKNPNIIKSGKQDKNYYGGMWKALLNPKIGFWRDEIVDKRKDGKLIDVILSISTIFDKQGKVAYFIANHVDISEMKKKTHDLERFAKLSEGRELVMIDMKKKIKELEKKLK